MKKTLYLIIVIIVMVSFGQLIPPDNYTEGGEKKFGSYNVKNGKFQNLVETEFTEDKKNGIEDIKNYIEVTLPDKYKKMIYSLEIMTDGEGGNDAYVYMDNLHSKDWVICVDYIDVFDSSGDFSNDFGEIIAHETMHIITLNDTQIDNNSGEDTYVADEGKLKKNSTLNTFYEKFWKENMDIHESFMKLGEDLGTVEYFKEYPDTFVTSYAAINPEEDIAESFAYFVTWDKPTGGKIYEQKILFFYDYPELLEIRKQMRIAINNI